MSTTHQLDSGSGENPDKIKLMPRECTSAGNAGISDTQRLKEQVPTRDSKGGYCTHPKVSPFTYPHVTT